MQAAEDADFAALLKLINIPSVNINLPDPERVRSVVFAASLSFRLRLSLPAAGHHIFRWLETANTLGFLIRTNEQHFISAVSAGLSRV